MEKLNIWGARIPYNSSRQKKEDMSLKRGPKLLTTLAGFKAIFSTTLDKPEGVDGITWLREIQEGEGEESYTDVPYLVPYIVKGSKYAVILAPGGGFCFKTMKEEGIDIAEFLNKKGISAFVLNYRINPYRYPVFCLDLKRAVQFLRVNEEKLGIAGSKIGAMGFSAGGYVVGRCLLEPELAIDDLSYLPDEVDRADARLDFGALLYPLVSFEKSPNMLYTIEGSEVYQSGKCETLKKKHDLISKITGKEPRQFICYGSKEPLPGAGEYYEMLQKQGVDSYRLILEGASHGFGSCLAKGTQKYAYWMEEFVKWLTKE